MITSSNLLEWTIAATCTFKMHTTLIFNSKNRNLENTWYYSVNDPECPWILSNKFARHSAIGMQSFKQWLVKTMTLLIFFDVSLSVYWAHFAHQQPQRST